MNPVVVFCLLASAATPIPHPGIKAGVIIVSGLAGGTACSKPGRWVGDGVSAGVGFVRDKISKLKPPSLHLPWP